ncbi:MAG: transglycosylase domain-containing protein [Clostridia bacterium]|nr:transglycosylase domain-containing protein [Clostridia bacterium]
MKKALKILLFCSLIVLTLSLCALFYGAILVKNANLDCSKLKTNTVKYTFYDNQNNKIDANLLKNDNYVLLSELNEHTINAFIAIEDRRFYKHNGIDYKRILGAMLNNVKSMSLKEGASTISQQLVKNTHLSSEKTFKRKLAEIKITRQLEKEYTKGQILEMYLNTIYFGSGAYGINSASLTYFNKPAKELTLNESAVLAGIIKAPSKYSPLINYDNCFNRKNVVLKCMNECGFISDSNYKLATIEQITLAEKNNSAGLQNYIDACKNEFDELLLNPYQNLEVKIYTALDVKAQKYLTELTVENEPNYDRKQIIINTKNNEVIAFYGNNSNLKRCPASCVKPWLVYAPILNEKFTTLSTVVNDAKKNFSGYMPSNYNDKYYGNVTVKTAIEKSLNVPAVELLNDFGIEKACNYAKKMNVNIENKDLSIALGAINNGMTLKEICDCYSPFTNNGSYTKSHFIRKVVVGNKEVYSSNNKSIRVFEKETAFLISDALKSAVKNGTSKKLRSFDFDVCAKTGTNGIKDGNLDAYSIAYTTNHIIGTWIGNNDNSLMDNSVTGANYPTIYTGETISYLYKNFKPSNIEIPNTIIKEYIDENALINNEELLIVKGGTPYYYISGTQPTKVKNLNLTIINDISLTLNNNVVTINLDVENATTIKINREYKNKIETIYNNRNLNKFTDKIYNFGKYNYNVYVYNNTQLIKEIKLPTVNYTVNNLSIIKGDSWLND